MIELTAKRIKDNLVAYLPGNLTKMKDYWYDTDMSVFGRTIEVNPPRNDSGGSAYFIGMPDQIVNYPSLIIIPNGRSFSNDVNVKKCGFQYETHNFEIRIYLKMSNSEKLELLTRGLTRLTETVCDTLRFHAYLEDPISGTDGICMSLGISPVNYHPNYPQGGYFLKASNFNVSCKVLDSVRNRPYLV